MTTKRVQHLLSGKSSMFALVNQIRDLGHCFGGKPVGTLCGNRYAIGHDSYVNTWGYYQSGILLLNRRDLCEDRTSDAFIFIATNRDAQIVPSDSRIPRLNQGELVKVWDCGKWTKEGPWQKHIEVFLEQVVVLVDKLEAKEELIEKEKSRIAKEEQRCEEEALLKEWS